MSICVICGELIHNRKEKNEKYECWQSTSDTCDYCNLQPNLFPDVSWRDGNPTEVKLYKERNRFNETDRNRSRLE